MRRHGVHDQAAGISRLAPRHIDTDPIQRSDFLPQQAAISVAIAPAFARVLFLHFVVAAHALYRGAQGVLLLGGQAVKGVFKVRLRQLQPLHIGRVQTVKARGVFQHGGIAARAHVAQDVGYALLDGGVGFGAPVQAVGKGRFKIGLRGAQPQWLSLQKGGLQSIHAGIVEMFAPCREVFCRGVCSRPDLTHRQAFMRQIASIWTVYMQSHTAHDEGEPAILDKKSRIMLVFPL